MKYTRGQASPFYFACSYGRIDEVLQTLDAKDAPSIEELNRLQDNGSTPLHAATHYNHFDIVRLLLERNCPRTALNRFGNTAYEEASTPEMKQLFDRSSASDRFHETDTAATVAVYLPEGTTENAHANESVDYVQLFRTNEEIFEYTLNQQTAAMWLKFYDWVMHTFRKHIEREHLRVDAFDLQNHPDLRKFLKQNLDDQKIQETMKLITKAGQSNSIEPLILLYTSERAGFYRPFNRSLVHSSSTTSVSPHSCDRFLFEFQLRRDELKKLAFTGTVYRGVTMFTVDLEIYRRALSSRPVGVIGLKTFTSTTRDLSVAMRFALSTSTAADQVNAVFVFEISHVTPTIFGVETISVYGQEQEVLILPGNLFTVTRIEAEDHLSVTKIYLKHWYVPISFWKKLRQTIRAGDGSVLA